MGNFILALLILLLVNPLRAQTPAADGTQPTDGSGAEAGQAATGEEGAGEAAKVDDSGKDKISDIQQALLPFQYNREEYRDPFETQGSGSPLKPGQVYGPFLPLQNFKLTQFKLKGLMWGTKNPVAIFRSPDGAEYRLTIKDYIGENFGYVASIREKEVVVIQTIEENQKRYSTTKVVFLE